MCYYSSDRRRLHLRGPVPPLYLPTAEALPSWLKRRRRAHAQEPPQALQPPPPLLSGRAPCTAGGSTLVHPCLSPEHADHRKLLEVFVILRDVWFLDVGNFLSESFQLIKLCSWHTLFIFWIAHTVASWFIISLVAGLEKFMVTSVRLRVILKQ